MPKQATSKAFFVKRFNQPINTTGPLMWQNDSHCHYCSRIQIFLQETSKITVQLTINYRSKNACFTVACFISDSLRVNLDLGKVVYSWFIQRDKDIPNTVVRSTTIPEELGRIQYLMSDKTGTLTQNEMVSKTKTGILTRVKLSTPPPSYVTTPARSKWLHKRGCCSSKGCEFAGLCPCITLRIWGWPSVIYSSVVSYHASLHHSLWKTGYIVDIGDPVCQL